MILQTAFFSIFIQAITSLIDVYGLTLPVDDNYIILKEILQIELGVQLIELIFYIWLVFSIHTIKNITKYRYADWFITTPIMLITLMAYLEIEPNHTMKFSTFLQEHKQNILLVVGLNILMLLFGYLSEVYPKDQIFYVILGFFPFVAYFYLIYKEYLQKEKSNIHPIFTRQRIFWYFVIVWSFYGIAAFFPYVLKNTFLNILDLFSKNAFGIMLVYIISHHTTSSPFESILSQLKQKFIEEQNKDIS
jgi:bacteriorhodopsin